MSGPEIAGIEIVSGDITRLDIDVIVNAANSALRGGGGVDGAIHRAAGPELADAAGRLAPCPTGQARITPGFRLKAKWVVHTVGPVWHGGTDGEDALLAACYRNALALAHEKGAAGIAFPAISTGIYGFPIERAAPIAVGTVAASLAMFPVVRVLFVCFDRTAEDAHRRALDALHN
jgi:O-acetyl-ADP-ribose deacetylase (regulator of RNase III)